MQRNQSQMNDNESTLHLNILGGFEQNLSHVTFDCLIVSYLGNLILSLVRYDKDDNVSTFRNEYIRRGQPIATQKMTPDDA